MSTRRSQPPRGRKSRNPAASPTEVPVIIPPPARAVNQDSMPPHPDTHPDTPEGELAAIEAGWDELLG